MEDFYSREERKLIEEDSDVPPLEVSEDEGEDEDGEDSDVFEEIEEDEVEFDEQSEPKGEAAHKMQKGCG